MSLRLTDRLVLRQPAEDDFARYFAINADPATNRFNPHGPQTDRAAAAEAFGRWLRHWREHGYGQWAVATRERPDHVIGFGGIALRAYGDMERVNLGYRFDVAAWGQGYATELAAAALDYGLAELGLPALHALVRPAHAVSIRVLEKTGMRRCGELDDVPGQAPSLVYVTPYRSIVTLTSTDRP